MFLQRRRRFFESAAHTVSGGASGSVTLAYTDYRHQSPGSFTDITETNVAIGAAASDRIVMLISQSFVGGGSTLAPTINGTNMTLISSDGTTPKGCSSWYLSVPTGTTCTLVGHQCFESRFHIFTVTGQNGGASGTPDASSFQLDHAADGDYSKAITLPTNGKMVLGVYAAVGGGNAHVWTNATKYTDLGTEQANNVSAAHMETSATITIHDPDDGFRFNNGQLFGICWAP